MNSDFVTNKKLFICFQSLYWKLFIGFSIFLIGFSLLLLTSELYLNDSSDTHFPFFIGDGMMNQKINDSSDSSNVLVSVNQILNLGLLSAPTIIYFSIILLILIKKMIIDEIHGGQSWIWLTSKNSKGKIIFSKILFIFSFVSVLFFIEAMIILIFSSFARDSSQYFGQLVLLILNFYIFLIFLTFLFITISLLLTNNPVIVYCIFSGIMIYLFGFWMLKFIFSLNLNYKYEKLFKFFTPESLIYSTFSFRFDDYNDSWSNTFANNWKFFEAKIYKTNNYWVMSLMDLFLIFSSGAMAYWNINIYKNKNFYF